MIKKAIRSALSATPFRPFKVRLTDGQALPVGARDFAHISANGRLLVVFTDRGSGLRTLDVALVTELQEKAAA